MIPIEDAVLAAIYSGADSVGKVASALRIPLAKADEVVRVLEARGYVRRRVCGAWIFRREKLELTREGEAKAREALEKLEEIASSVKSRVDSGEDINEIATQLSYILPLLVWLDLIDLAMLDMLMLDAMMWSQ